MKKVESLPMLRVYEVNSPGGNAKKIEAKNSQQAKRIYCRLTGRKPGDWWSGMGVLSARQIKEQKEA